MSFYRAHCDVQVGDHLIVSNPHRSRFAIVVDRVGADHRYVFGRVFSIATFERDGMVAYNGRTKVASLRPTTTLERVVPHPQPLTEVLRACPTCDTAPNNCPM